MYFNSTAFFWFLTGFLLLFFLVRGSLVNRNRLIVAASYFFYGWWDWRFLSLLLLPSVADFFVGSLMENATGAKRRRLLAFSLLVNLGVLGFFKYFDFFWENVFQGLSALGIQANVPMLNVILPVGISFYTFQRLSYTIDVFRGRVKPTRDIVAFLAYVSFFPQLVAGPIERAASLLPQFTSARRITVSGTEMGVWLIVWGLFKKVVIADNMGPLVDMVYTDPTAKGPVIALATLAFGVQIYCDFSGYSDIARGVASMLGFQLMLNFNLPYFAVTPSDFWRRWHISLSTWFRDYVYIPLGGNRRGAARNILSLLLTMLLAGLWHGAGWNFILWGLWHGVMLGIFRNYSPEGSLRALLGWMVTMAVVFYGWMLFRAQSFEQIRNYTVHIWLPEFPDWFTSYGLNVSVFLVPLVLMQLWQKKSGDLMPALRLPAVWRYALQSVMLYCVAVFGVAKGTPFIYFQF
ncbi:MAG: Peptidoglycan O-acetyltransferase [Verrucomicrobia subdivision 3 bacterium]|nr:Peptidoglycan O-acetyltransferase [Limisphaerales bacterium]MCS1415570.1 Peptidoglycan O-acetyltransferase [Limisphaerales bacterium]